MGRRPEADTERLARGATARCVSIQKRPNEARTLLVAFSQRSAGEENNSQQDVDDVIHCAEHQQRADIKHVVGTGAQEPAAYAQK